MDLLNLFKQNLLRGKGDPSPLTVKNYLADISQFIRWYELTFQQAFNPNNISKELFTQYRQSRELSERSFERHLSSLRKFFYFLGEEKVISSNPFKITESKHLQQDPWHFKEFKDYLYVYGASDLTIKNYIIDLKSFQVWIESTLQEQGYIVNKKTPFEKISTEIIEDYKERLLGILHLSPRTVNRKLSSIRKFLQFGVSYGYTNGVTIEEEFVNVNIDEGTGQIAEETLSLEDIDQKTQDSQQKPTYSSFAPVRLLQRLFIPYLLLEDKIAAVIAKFLIAHRLVRSHLSPRTLTSKLQNTFSNLPKSFYAPHAISLAALPWHQRALHHIRYTRPKWYKRYHSYTFTKYLHFAILVIFAAAIGFAIYNGLVEKPKKNLFAAPAAPPRVLSFQGRLTDANDNPITSSTAIRFAIYNDLSASGAALLWEEVQYTVTPDQDGIFSVLLGSTTAITSTVFSDNSSLYLGVTIGITPELTPRQRIAAVAYATNSEFLQGMPPITQVAAGTTNVILALDSSGNLTIGGSANPTFSASGGQFKLSGQPLLLTTNASSNGNIHIVPDGLGRIDVQKPLVNTSSSGNIIGGAVEVNDRFAVLATESATAAFIVNNNTTGGDIIAASSSGSTKFVIENDGDIRVTAGQTLDTLTAGTLGIGTVNATTLTIGRSSQGITLPGFTSQNGVLYGTHTTGVLAQATTASTGLCLLSGASNPAWTTCPGGSSPIDTFWNQTSGLLYPNNSTVDFAIGGQASTSAKFAILNVNSGTPVATLSAGTAGASYFTASGTYQTTANQTMTLGGDTTGNILLLPRNSSGNVGINSVVPGATLDVTGTGRFSTTLTASSNFTVTAGSITFSPFTSNGGPLYTNGSGVVAQATAGASNQCLLGGTTPSFGSCATGPDTFWQQSNGSLFPNNSTVDFFIGGQASTSAKFAILNVNSGTPVASISAGTAGAVYLTADGKLATTALQRLLIGDLTTTGDVLINPAGNIGIASLTPGAKLDVTGTGRFSSTLTASNGLTQTTGALSLTATSGSVGLTLTSSTTAFNVNSGVFDIDTTNNRVGIGTTAPLNRLDVRGINATTATATISASSNFAALVITNTIGDLIAASGSGVPNFRVKNNGDLVVGLNGGGKITAAVIDPYLILNDGAHFPELTFQTTSTGGTDDFIFKAGSSELVRILEGGNVGIGVTNPSSFKLEVAGNIGPEASGTRSLGSSTRLWNTVYVDQLCFDGAVDCASSSNALGSKWDIANGTLFPKNSTLDLLIGATATSSAKFAVLNVNSGIPTASVSAGAAGATYLTADGKLATTAKQTLQLGDSTTTGDILIQGGNIGISTAVPTTKFDIDTGSNTLGLRLRGTAEATEIGDIYVNAGGGLVLSTANTGAATSFIEVDAEDNDYGLIIRDSSTGSTNYANLYLTDSGSNDYLNIVVNNTTGGATGLVVRDGGNVGVGTTAPADRFHIHGTDVAVAGPHIRVTTTADAFPLFQNLNFSHDNISLNLDAYYDGAWKSGDAGSNYQIYKVSDQLQLNYTSGGVSGGSAITWRTAFVLNTSGNIGIGTSSPNSQLYVSRPLSLGALGKSLLMVDQIESADILTASAAGVTKFTIQNDGTLVSGKYTGQNAALYATQTTGVIAQATTASTGLCLLSGASAPAWTTCPGGTTGFDVFWNQTSGLLYPNNSTVDFAIGGQATTSAKFAVLNVNSGITTATVSGNLIVFRNSGAGGNVGIGTTTPNARLAFDGDTAASGGILFGTDTNLYRSATDTLTTDDNFNVGNNLTVATSIILTSGGNITTTSNGDIGLVPDGTGQVNITSGVTSGNALQVTANSLTTGNALSISSSSTAGGGANSDYLINLSRSGTNSNGSHTAYGISSSVTNTGSSSTNIAGYFSATGATNNYSGIFLNGYVGIGTSAPAHLTQITGISANNAVFAVNAANTISDILTASSSGTPRFVIRNDGNVGIGSTLPATKLDIVDTTGSNGYIAQFTRNSRTFAIYADTNAVDIGTRTAHALDFFTADGSIQMRLETSGNLGLGTTDTGNARLTVAGSGGIGQAIQLDNKEVKFRGDGDAHYSFFANRISSTFTFEDSSNSAVSGTAGTVLWSAENLSTGGNIGIGTSTPLAELYVTRPLSFGANGKALVMFDQIESQDILTGSASGTTKFKFSNGGTLQAASFQDIDNTAYFLDPAAAGNAMAVLGNVGIGSTSPASILDIVKSQNAASDAFITNANGGTSATAGWAVVSDSVSAAFRAYPGTASNSLLSDTAVLFAASTASNGLVLDTDASAPITFYTGGVSSTTERMRIASDGTIGIGTTVPLARLDVRAINAITPAASFSAKSRLAALIVDNAGNQGVNDIIAASASGATKFAVRGDGRILLGDKGSTGDHALCQAGEIYFNGTDNLFKGCTASNSWTSLTQTDNVKTGNGTSNVDIAGTETSIVTVSITPKSATSEVLIIASANILISSTTDQVTLRIRRTNCSGTQVGVDMIMLVVTTSGSNRQEVTSTGIDAPATTSATTYALCGIQTQAAETSTAKQYTITAMEVNQGADLAEVYGTTDNKAQLGNIVSYDTAIDKAVTRSTGRYDKNIMGVVSTSPSLLIGKDGSYQNLRAVPIALAGRVPIKVSTENGPIEIGDSITSSSIRGIGMRAVLSGMVVGKAMERFNPETTPERIEPCPEGTPQHIVCGKVTAFIGASWKGGDILITDAGQVKIEDSTPSQDSLFAQDFKIRDTVSGKLIEQIGAFASIVTGSIKSGFISTQTLLVSTNAKILGTLEAQIVRAGSVTTNSLSIATDSVNIAGQSLREYIIQIVKDNTHASGGSAVAAETKTNIISPLGEGNITIQIGNSQTASNELSKLSIKNDQFQEIASIDEIGNARLAGNLEANDASLSGTLFATDASISGELAVNTVKTNELETNSLQTTDASVSGTLRADTIIANNIEGLDDKIEQAIKNQTPAVATSSSLASSTGSSSGAFNLQGSGSTAFLDISNLSSDFALIRQGFISLGASTFHQITIMDSLTFGTDFTIGNHTLNVLGADIEIQPLKQGGVNFLAGEVKIDTNGNLSVNGNATIAGNVYASNAQFRQDVEINGNLSVNMISPLPDQDLIIQLGPGSLGSSSGILNGPKFEIRNASGSAILAVNQLGDVIASGAASFAKLNLLAQPAYALSDTESLATGSAGTAILKANKPELTIKTGLVTKNSLIYITPTADTGGRNLYLLRQVEGVSFTVGIGQVINREIPFNWIIVN